MGQLNSLMQKNRAGLFTAYTKFNSNCIKELNLRAKTRKLLEKNIGVNLHELELDKELVDMTPKYQQQQKQPQTK